ncbi:outer membrane protein assembly factor BamD [Photobacterium iliopiscarium]|jgi:outer membrane protein assembly factor BamD|uniref:Outer membrane protein assembly factor BamD n=1 Tax=Photobacterium iliopiscarium TaxID=56192 RepID=A0A2T3M8L3_9GAMM|nr:outer membrane protein assembly factor BamD [Photobacterium iliopiscarium]KJG13211.1 membrane protein [Photobacterium iliopiscarium]PST86324.1 outer membrane protein assembly factor BamD [Photobacterium iliopiscarium]PST97502.1 outer membrane protein assembly factor BamD [Photobacterium iliopiscarium]PSV79307.1 outer membrane protein assembly factor BamD [Photobacterium iliopiscarium]PSV88869.1 outer membrane protein assembly factor BamD [Photobacterium iliopiscarium]
MKRLTISTFLAVALLSGCSSTEKVIPDVPPSDLYSTAQQALQSGNWNNAIERLEAMDSRYPFGAYSDQVQLDLIYAYYKNDDLPLSQATIARFLRLNPTHPQADWVYYMRGLTHMAQDRSFMHDMFNIDRFDRDPTPSRQAFRDFKYLLERFPDSQYDADAKARMVFLKNQLAEYDLAVADFYVRREAWIAAINRCQQVQRLYPNTSAARKSLLLEKTAYEKLKLNKEVARTEAVIKLNPVK